jgi:penicillin amidase
MNTGKKCLFTLFLIALWIFPGAAESGDIQKETLHISGLSEPVEMIKDSWGISHIYAKNQKDLFFAQGFNVARDRLFQLEIWRRQATGTLAEILGERVLDKDIGARLLKARVDKKKELNFYHPQGEEIITSFVAGINAFIDFISQDPESLPIEFGLLGIKPGHWTPEVVVSRHNGLFRNASFEVSMAQTAQIMGIDFVSRLLNLHPGSPDIGVQEGIDLSLIDPEILHLYSASRSRIRFVPEDIIDPALRAQGESLDLLNSSLSLSLQMENSMDMGSNNWVIRGEKTFTGKPIMANDPHRTQQIPSLRYWVHLNAPGWNVIGGGEPALPGISIGHNEYGAWGLTIFSVDQEDLYVYDTNPEDADQYRYKGKWEKMTVIDDTIAVKGKSLFPVKLKYTRHGPVLYEDQAHNKAYALRAAWLEIGAAPYLASLRMDQSKNWPEFREACSYSRTPSENMVWADGDNNIGWQAVGITPLRKNWHGLLPVPGDGRFEWDGYLPIKRLPHLFNPPQGYFASANQDNIPADYPINVGYVWTDPFRFARIEEVLGSAQKFTMTDMILLQHDHLSLPARSLVPLLQGLQSENPQVQSALNKLLSWNCVMDTDSIEASIYTVWERNLSRNVWELSIPPEARRVFPQRSLKKMIDFLLAPDGRFGPSPTSARDALLLRSLEEGINELNDRLGPDKRNWQYGQENFHHITVRHLLSSAVSDELRSELDVGPLPRGGNSYTVNNTSSGYNQTSGASFRIIADLSDWDNSLGSNTPGQSGNPDSRHYADLFKMWAEGRYFPVLYSREKIESAAEKITVLLQEKKESDGDNNK